MENETFENTSKINSLELLNRFIFECKKIADKQEHYPLSLCSADIITAVHYFRKFPDVNDFFKNVYQNNKNYFQLQWVRSVWARFSKMTSLELSDLVINQITLVANLQEEQ